MFRDSGIPGIIEHQQDLLASHFLFVVPDMLFFNALKR
jgi:hypothetical protein